MAQWQGGKWMRQVVKVEMNLLNTWFSTTLTALVSGGFFNIQK